MFERLENEYGITSYLAHNMTVTPTNIDQIADVIRSCHDQGWRMFSFQPAAYIGNEHRWRDGYRELTSDRVWNEVETGAGTPLPYGALQFGDTRCNRVTWGAYLGDRYTPLARRHRPTGPRCGQPLAGRVSRQLRPERSWRVGVRFARSVAAHPMVVPTSAGWAGRYIARGGGWRQRWWAAKPVTFVMHQFIDAADTAAAWEHLNNGERAVEPRILEAQERLEAMRLQHGPSRDRPARSGLRAARHPRSQREPSARPAPAPTDPPIPAGSRDPSRSWPT